jgi:hypothetical protein
MVVESITDFQKRMYALSAEMNRQIREKAEEVKEKEMPDLKQLKLAPAKPPRTKVKLDTGLDWPSEVKAMRSKVHEQDYADTIMGSVNDMRGPNVTITAISKGHREDGRDAILKGVRRDGRLTTDIDDLRILFGRREGVKNEVLAGRIMEELSLPFYSEQGVIYQSPAERKKVA